MNGRSGGSMSLYISGSLAFDRIMTFPGNFQDHIMPDKLHMLNVSFMVDSMAERRGGCAGNIAYSLALLGAKPIIVACAGRDFDSYASHLEALGLPLDGISIHAETFTAVCYITTDMHGNQITGFYPGAMKFQSDYTFPNLDPENDMAIVSPGNIEDMRRLPRFYKERGVPYIFDPGQQLPVLDAADLLSAIQGSFACITNDYELGMICKTTGLSDDELLGRTLWLVTTLGEAGARVRGADGTDISVRSVPVAHVADPTGAGDAQRAGLLFGLSRGLEMPDAARLGSVSASYAIELMGTQEHGYCPAEFKSRYEKIFGPMPAALSDLA